MENTPAVAYAAIWFLLVNTISYLLMLLDKRRARAGAWRISESTLQFWFLIGGALGGKFAQRSFRHKTSKQPFAQMLNMSMGLNLIAYSLALYEPSRVFLVAQIGEALSR